MKGIDLHELTVTLGGREVLHQLTLSVERGEVVSVVGASGCGKSTLLRAIAGLTPIAGGVRAVQGKVAFVFQEPRLLPWRDVTANVAFAARDDEERARVAPLLERVGLAAATHLLPKQLSGGMAQRVALARALVRQPEVLLLDEPFSALDALRRRVLQDLLAGIVADSKAAVVFVTHDVDEALRLGQRVVVLAGSPSRVIAEVPGRPSNRERLLDLLSTEERERAEAQLHRRAV
ncbi:ATP-binding cassette domain-containing protein [bacterium]|nr:MAG: ATP-binding cassette domain-containing protein [bacterium]